MSRDEAKTKYSYFFSGKNGIGHWFTREEKLSEDEFDKMYPLVVSIHQKENSDKRKQWMNNVKSY